MSIYDDDNIYHLAAPYNSKSKLYPDGRMVVIYSNQYCFSMQSDIKKAFKAEMKKFRDWSAVDLDYNGHCFQPVKLRSFSYDISDPYFYYLRLKKYYDEQKGKRRRKEECGEIRDDNLIRARNKINDIILLNKWDYFFTGTLGDTKFDPTDAKAALVPLQNWLKNRVKRSGLKYILVAEFQPKSGRIHFHGFINDALTVTDSGTRLFRGHSKPMKKAKASRLKLDWDMGQIVYNLPEWTFGFTTAIKTYNDRQKVADYMQKYITKDAKSIFGKYYWSSKNIRREPDVYLEEVDFDSVPAKEISIPRTNRKLKYYTFFPGQSDFHTSEAYKQAAQNTAAILDYLSEFEEV